tara:strand:- start:7677 stop:8957 length:1281 start_codon:yes stop_codon:yes gene_type:complete
MKLQEIKIGIIGLGYVGLPLAVEFSKRYSTIGFDINEKRISQLKIFNDITKEVDNKLLEVVINKKLIVTCHYSELSECNFYIITVPTPIDKYKIPDLKPLISASETVGKLIKKNDVVVYESTVYPGCTENDCIPILEKESQLKFNKDFFCGYSPERINPGDKERTLTKIKKITSGSNQKSADFINEVYSSIIEAGTFKASSIKVAEAAKVIENSQRDINIAYVNELAKIFNLLNINTYEVLEAASTKWNFLNFKPGLVGGHCIGVDPYYLAHKASQYNYDPEIILSGRKINDSMAKFVVSIIIKNILKITSDFSNFKILVLGITFKENCPDLRNSKVFDLCNELKEYNLIPDVFDNIVSKDDSHLLKNYNFFNEFQQIENKKYDLIVLAVPHNEYDFNFIKNKLKLNGFIFDIKGVLKKNKIVISL